MYFLTSVSTSVGLLMKWIYTANFYCPKWVVLYSECRVHAQNCCYSVQTVHRDC